VLEAACTERLPAQLTPDLDPRGTSSGYKSAQRWRSEPLPCSCGQPGSLRGGACGILRRAWLGPELPASV